MRLEMSDKRLGSSDMSSVAEASILVRRLAEPRPAGDKVKAAIVRAARRCGLTYVRTREIWYENARRIEAREMDELRRRAERAEVELAIANLVALRRSLATTDSDFHRPQIAALDDALRAMGANVGSMAVSDI